MFKVAFRGVKKGYVIGVFTFALLFGLMNSLFADKLSRMVEDTFQSDILRFTLHTLILIVLWNTLEFCGDIFNGMFNGFVESLDYSYYFNRLYDIKPEVLSRNNTGYISGLLNKMIGKHVDFLEAFVCDIPIEFSFIVIYVIRFISIHWSLSLAIVVPVTIGIVLSVIVQEKYSTIAEKKLSDAEGERNKLFEDVVSNMKTVQKMGARGFVNNKSELCNANCMRIRLTTLFREEVAFMLNKSFGFISTPVALLVIYIFRDSLSLGVYEYALIGQVLTKIPYNIRAISRSFRRYARLKGNLVTLEQICSDENKRSPVFDGLVESIDIKNVSYSYIDSTTNKSVTVNIPEFRVDSGDFICVTGESGQGKTTLLDILSGQIETDSVTINGSIKGLRPDCVFISQDTEVLDMSIRDNLLLGRGDDYGLMIIKLLHCLNVVGMGEWLEKQPNGIDTMLGERGVFVSTGQRQRLNLIRGLLDDTKQIYLLDEPTSNVDEETEVLMINLIKNYLKDKTVICVTHRPRILELATKRYKFENSTLSLDTGGY